MAYYGGHLEPPQFDGHFKKYTIVQKGVSNEKEENIYTRV